MALTERDPRETEHLAYSSIYPTEFLEKWTFIGIHPSHLKVPPLAVLFLRSVISVTFPLHLLHLWYAVSYSTFVVCWLKLSDGLLTCWNIYIDSFEATDAHGRITARPQRTDLWTFPIEKVRQLWELTIFNFVTSVGSWMGQIWTNKLMWTGQETHWKPPWEERRGNLTPVNKEGCWVLLAECQAVSLWGQREVWVIKPLNLWQALSS